MQKQRNISISVAAAILLILTAAGSIWDYEIANAVYLGVTPSENIYGIIFSYIGVMPTFVGWSFLGACILGLSKKQAVSTKTKRWLTAFAVVLLVLSFFYYCNTLYFSASTAFKMHFAAAYSIGTAVICAAACLGCRLSQRSDDPGLLSKVLFLAAVSLLTLLIISAAKELMCRPRFRLVLAMDDTAYFRNWWQSGRALKRDFGTDIVTDEFASLPSGHSAYSMFGIFLFPALADCTGRTRKYKPYLFAFGFVWWALTALSRMTVGAHYLTDVTIAGLVTILSHAAVSAARKHILRKKPLRLPSEPCRETTKV